MPCAIVTAFHGSGAHWRQAALQLVRKNFVIIADYPATTALKPYDVPADPVDRIYPKLARGESFLFPTLDPVLYTDLVRGRKVLTSSGLQDVRVVIAEFKPYTTELHPDLDRPMLAIAAAMAVLWGKVPISILAGEGLGAEECENFSSEVIRDSWESREALARLALRRAEHYLSRHAGFAGPKAD